MKKNVLLTILIAFLAIFLVSCGGAILPGNQIGVLVTNWNAGPGVPEAFVRIYESGTQNLVGNGLTNENGGVAIKLTGEPEKIDISVVKVGHARSLVSGLKTASVVNTIVSVILQTAGRQANPDLETDPVVEMQWQALAGGRSGQREAEEPITGPFEVTVNVEAQRDVMEIYAPLLDQIPGSASVTSNSQLVRRTETAAFEISPTGFNGEVPLFTTVYDDNNNRVVKVEYIPIQGTNPEAVRMYQPMTFVDFSESVADYPAENIRSYTRRGSVNLRTGERVAPAQTNLWIQLYWADWTSLNTYYGPGSMLPDPADQPDGYNLYRSPDGQTYQKFAFLPESEVEGMAQTICEAIDWSNIDRVVNANPMGLDGSVYVMPNYPIYYRVTAVYGTLESTPTDLGSVMPLGAFEVCSDHPAHEATVDTLTPAFQWQPSEAVTSNEGIPVYHYGLYLEQCDAPANEILAVVNALNGFYEFQSNTPEQISMTFTGNQQNEEWNGCLWKWYNEDTQTYREYESQALLNNTSYIWYVPLAYAVVDDEDSKAFSIASDYKFSDSGWGIDPFGGFPYGERNRFETLVE